MKILLILGFIFVSGIAAAPASTVARRTNRSFPAIVILKQIHQINDDGSYTFGYEADDGTFRVENRDDAGYITGKYGYLDATGSLQEIEYVAGKYGGRSIGYQAKSPSIPIISRDAQGVFPVVRRTTVSPEQKARDYEYNSVDEDEDGIPDKPPSKRNNKDTSTVRPISITVPTTQAPKAVNQQTPRTTVEPKRPAPTKAATANIQEILKLTAESSAADELKMTHRERDMPTIAENTKSTKELAQLGLIIPAGNIRMPDDVAPQAVDVSYMEIGTSGLNGGRLIDNESNLMASESKVAEPERQLSTKDIQLSQGAVSVEDESLTQSGLRGITTGKLDEFLRELVARTKTKVENKTPTPVSQKPTAAPAPMQTLSAPDNTVYVDTLGFTRII